MIFISLADKYALCNEYFNVGFMSADCLDSFTRVEELQESEQYFCPRCKKRQISTKKLTIQRLPNVSG